MIKFNVLYKNRVEYPCKLSNLFIYVCNQVGLETGNVDFTNCNYIILGNPFTNNEDCRTVLSNIAQLAGGFAKIGRDNKVYIKTLKNISNLLDEKLNGNNYFDDFSKNEQWGELNSLVLGLSSVEGENTALDDKDSIAINGITELTIQDNYFLTDQAEREKIIVPIWNSLKGLKYIPFKTNYYGYPYLDSGDMIYIEDTEDKGFISYVFNHTFTFNGSFKGTLETPAMTKTQTAYKNTFELKTKFKRTERKIDKINGTIEDIVQETSEYSKKLTKVEQDIDSIKQKVEDVEDLTRTVTGIKKVSIEDAYENENILELHIYGNNRVFDYLYPQDDLFPSDTLYPYGDSKIRFKNSNEEKIIELGIDEVLRANDEVKDELSIIGTEVNLIRRVNADGKTKEKEEKTYLGTLRFILTKGINEFEIVNYYAELTIKYAIKSTYSDIFATKAELSSEIQQTSKNINLNVDKRLENYSTTMEMNSAIELTAEEINNTVSKKVGEDEIISKINQSAESVTIDANKISLNGKKINLTGDNIVISSNNFNVDKNGNMNCNAGTLTNVNIKGGDIKLYPSEALRGIRIFSPSNPDNSQYMTYMSNNSIGCNDGYNNSAMTPDSIGVGNSTMWSDHITTPYITQTSLEKEKKNFEKFENALEEIKKTEIYKYNLKSQDDNDKKHIGFVIGKNYNYSDKITSTDKEGNEIGVDIYSMISLAYKAIQEQQETIEQLYSKIKELEGK